MTTLLICALATYRVVRLAVLEEGPFSLALRLRGVLDPDARTWVGRGMQCPWCISFWVAPALVFLATDPIGALLVQGLAVSALVGLGMTYGPMTYDRWRRGK